MDKSISGPEKQLPPYNYHLEAVEFDALESTLISEVKDTTGLDTIHAVWIPSNHPYASLIRTEEIKKFPEIQDVMEPFEEQSVFLALADTRPESKKIVHAFRLSSLSLTGQSLPADGASIGIVMLDDVITNNASIDVAEFVSFYQSRGIDLAKSLSVETNFRIEKVKTETGLPVPQLGYLAIFRTLEGMSEGVNDAAVFAALNKVAILSLKKAGIHFEPMAGREDLQLPTVDADGNKGFDPHYRLVALPPTTHNNQVFSDLMPFAAPEIKL